MKQLLIIKADTNDADYVHSITEIKGYLEEHLPTIRKVAQVIKDHKPQYTCSWGTSYNCSADEHPREVYKGLLTEEEIDIFSDVCPSGENGIHSIEGVQILTVTDDETLVGYI